MATKVQEYSSDSDSNSTVDSANVAENCNPAGINNAIRGLMAHIKTALSGSDDSIITGTAGTSGNIAVWNADGDLVDGGSIGSPDDDSVTPAKMADGDFGAFTVTSNVATLDADTVGTSQLVADSVTPDELEDTAVTPAAYTNANITVDAQGRVTAAANGTAGTVATQGPTSASGATVDFSGIATGAQSITIMSEGLSFDGGSDDLAVQLSTGATFKVSGYTSGSTNNDVSTGFGVRMSSSGRSFHGRITLERVPGTNRWASSHGGYVSAGTTVHGGGSVDLGGELDGIRLTGHTSTDSFDAGSASIRVEFQ